MSTGWLALREGFARLRRYWPALLAAYGVNLISALLLALFPALGLLGAAQRPALAEAAHGISANMVIDFMGSGILNATQGLTPDGRAFQWAALWALVTAAVLPFVAGLPAAFLNGGLVLAYVESPARFTWKRFLWGCWRWFSAFLMLGLGQVLVTLLVGVPAIILIGLASGRAPWAVGGLALILALALAVSLALFELAGVWMVSRGSRNFARALWQALVYLVRHAGALAVLYALALGGLGLVHALYLWGIWPRLPLEVWPVVLVAQQAFILLRLGARLLRLSACAVLMPSPNAP